MKSLKLFLFALLITSPSFLLGDTGLISVDPQTHVINSKDLILLTNIERERNNLPLLKENEILNRVAQLKAEDMVRNGYFAHNSLSGQDPWYWFKLAGYRYTNAGENLAILFKDSHSIVSGWMNSPSHRANILDSKFTQIGMAVVKGNYNGVETSYVVEVFGNPQPAPTKVISPSNPKAKKVTKITTKKSGALVSKK